MRRARPTSSRPPHSPDGHGSPPPSLPSAPAPAAASWAGSAKAPAWVTPELIAETLDCWQPHFAKALTADDALEILTNVGRLLDALG